jgi:hypothetical protein
MIPPSPPKITAVEVVATRPTDADRRIFAVLRERDDKTIEEISFVVKLRFAAMPEPTSLGWALYVGSERIPKYWSYKHGIYFKVYELQYFAEHRGDSIRFSLDHHDFVDTGHRLADPSGGSSRPAAGTSPLPTLDQALDD